MRLLTCLSVFFCLTATTFAVAESPIRTIELHESGPFPLAKLNKNTCYQISLHMKVSCMPTEERYEDIGTSCGLAHIYIDYGNELNHVKRLWRHFTSITNGKVIGNNIVNDDIIISNSTDYQPRLIIKKGYNCQESPLTIDIYRLDIKEISCSPSSIFTTDNLFRMMFVLFPIGIAAIYMLN